MSRTELDGMRAQIESEPVLIADGVEVTVAGLREMLERAKHRQLEGRDCSVLAALISELIAEAGDREIVTLTVDDEYVQTVFAEESTPHCTEGTSRSDEVGRG